MISHLYMHNITRDRHLLTLNKTRFLYLLKKTLSQRTYFFQVKWRHYSAETLHDIAQYVTDSSRNNHNIPQLVQDEGCPVKFYDWKAFLKQFFKPLSSLTHLSSFSC
jgi:hypothetical protein